MFKGLSETDTQRQRSKLSAFIPFLFKIASCRLHAYKAVVVLFTDYMREDLNDLKRKDDLGSVVLFRLYR